MAHNYLDNMKKAAAIRRRNEIQNGGTIIHDFIYPKFNPYSTVDDLSENLQLWLNSWYSVNSDGEIKCNVLKNCDFGNIVKNRYKIKADGLQISRRNNPFLKPDCLSSIVVKFYYETESSKIYNITVEADFVDNSHAECYKRFSLIDSAISKLISSGDTFNNIVSINFYASRVSESLLNAFNFKEMSSEESVKIIKNQWSNLFYMLQAMLGRKFNSMIGSIPQIMLDNYNGTIGEFYAKLVSFYLPTELRDVQFALTNYDFLKDSTLSDTHIRQKDFITSVKEGMKSFSNLYQNF